MNDYTKKVRIKLEVDEDSLNKVNEKVKGISIKESLKSLTKTIKSEISDGLKKISNNFLDGLKSTFKEAWKELDNMLDYSRLSNAKTRELAFTYGFSGSEAYGFEKAKSIMGIESDEDLMYLTGNQSSKFQELMSKYTEKYSELYDSGFFDSYEDFQYEMEDLKQELMMEVVEFFIENKDTIKTGFKAALEFFKITMKALEWIVDLLGGDTGMSDSERAAITSDIINQSSVSNSSSKNVTQNNTYNNVGSEDREWLANAGQMTYEQIIQALT